MRKYLPKQLKKNNLPTFILMANNFSLVIVTALQWFIYFS